MQAKNKNHVLYKKYFGLERRDWFIVIVLLTIIFARIMIWYWPADSFIFYDKLHHIYYGILLLLVVLIMDRKLHHVLLVPFGIAIGLIVDEVTFLLPLIYDSGKAAYFSFPSVFGIFILVLVVFIFRDQILWGLEKID